MPKKTEREGLWDFSTSILLQNSKKSKKGPFPQRNFFFEKSPTISKKSEGGTLCSRLLLYVVTRETFLVQLLGPPGIFWRLL